MSLVDYTSSTSEEEEEEGMEKGLSHTHSDISSKEERTPQHNPHTEKSISPVAVFPEHVHSQHMEHAATGEKIVGGASVSW